MKRRVRLSVTTVYRQTTIQEKPPHAFCQICGQETEMLTTAKSAALLEIELSGLFDLIASGKIHAMETAAGNLRVCKNSLFRNLEMREI